MCLIFLLYNYKFIIDVIINYLNKEYLLLILFIKSIKLKKFLNSIHRPFIQFLRLSKIS